jgi:tRNA 2-thiouridine synthesizing protein A
MPPMAIHRLDVRGLLCPLPVRLAARALEALPDGAELEIEGNDLAMRIDVPAFAAREGHRLLSLVVEGHTVVARLRKGGVAVADGPPA